MAIVISVLAFTALAWASSGFTHDFMRVARPKQPAPSQPLLSGVPVEADRA